MIVMCFPPLKEKPASGSVRFTTPRRVSRTSHLTQRGHESNRLQNGLSTRPRTSSSSHRAENSLSSFSHKLSNVLLSRTQDSDFYPSHALSQLFEFLAAAPAAFLVQDWSPSGFPASQDLVPDFVFRWYGIFRDHVYRGNVREFGIGRAVDTFQAIGGDVIGPQWRSRWCWIGRFLGPHGWLSHRTCLTLLIQSWKASSWHPLAFWWDYQRHWG